MAPRRARPSGASRSPTACDRPPRLPIRRRALGARGEKRLALADVAGRADGAPESERLLQLAVGLGTSAFGDELLSGTQTAERLVRQVPDLEIHLGRALEIAPGKRRCYFELRSRALDGCYRLEQLI